MMFKYKNTNVSLHYASVQNERMCNSNECSPQEEPLNKMAEAAYHRAERWCSGYQVPLEIWFQAEKEVDNLIDSIDVLQIDNDF